MPVVDIAPEGSPAYQADVSRGSLSTLGAHVGDAHAVALIADDRVDRLWGERAREALSAAGARVVRLTFPAGEASKTRETWARLTDELLDAGLGRDALVVGLGGGVTTDLAGFVAATYLRGLPWIAVPTTLLAMVDASVGGKTGVDHPSGKNLVGAFHHPRRVVIDPEVLATLDDREVGCGLAEVIKHALIGGRAAALDEVVSWAKARRFGGDGAAEVIASSLAVKAALVARDPFERGPRALLNAGHTIGHALERVSGLSIPHGEAVAVGLVVEARISAALGWLGGEGVARLIEALAAVGLPTRLGEGVEPRAVLAATATDKKGRAGRPRYVLLAALGAAVGDEERGWTREVDDAVVLAALEESR